MAEAVPALREEIRKLARRTGVEEVGFAGAQPFGRARQTLIRRREDGHHGGMSFTYRNPDRSTDPARALPGARALVVGARSYRRADVEPPRRGPAWGAVARYSWDDSYAPLRRGLEAVAARLESAGYRARVLVDDNALVDRAAAFRAGLGWFGKNTMLLLERQGSWFVLGSVVTDAPLVAEDKDPEEPSLAETTEGGCGACTRCLAACPTGALVAPGVLDAGKCLAWLLEAPGDFPLEYREALGGRIYGCDSCQEVCPPNRANDRRRPPPPAPPGAEPWVDLVEVLALTDQEILERFGRWYIPERQPRYVRRNALVALGNVGDAAAPEVRAALIQGLADPDPMLRSHARWAAERLGAA